MEKERAYFSRLFGSHFQSHFLSKQTNQEISSMKK